MFLILEVAAGIVLGVMVLAFWPYVLAIGAVLVALLILVIGWTMADAWAPGWPALLTVGLLVSGAVIYRKKLWPGDGASGDIPPTV
jgi:hypothetical protein